MEILNSILAILKKYSWFLFIGTFTLLIWLWIANKKKTNEIAELNAKNNIQAVLLDTMTVRSNKLGSITAEKEAYEVELSFLQKDYDKLNAGSKELLNKIKVLENKKLLIEATNISQKAKIDSLINNKPNINKPKGIVTYKDSIYNKDKTVKLKYEFIVRMLDYQLTIKSIEMPNKLYISHKYSKDKSKVLVDVINSNEYFKTLDIDGYIISLNRNTSHFKTYLMIGGIGVGMGIITGLVFLK